MFLVPVYLVHSTVQVKSTVTLSRARLSCIGFRTLNLMAESLDVCISLTVNVSGSVSHHSSSLVPNVIALRVDPGKPKTLCLYTSSISLTRSAERTSRISDLQNGGALFMISDSLLLKDGSFNREKSGSGGGLVSVNRSDQ